MLTAVGLAFLLLTSALVVAADRRPRDAVYATDYVAALYIGGCMLLNGAQKDLYPPIEATTFKNEKFAQYGDKLLGGINPTVLYLFMYPPAMAVIVAPFCAVDPTTSLVLWQIFSGICLVLSSWLFSKVEGMKGSWLNLLAVAGIFLPVFNVILIGQTSVAFGLLPTVCGYLFWMKKKPLLAGLCWSLLATKPHLLIPQVILFSALCLSAVSKKGKATGERSDLIPLALGTALGAIALAVGASLIVGWQSYLLWAHAARLAGEIFARADTGYWQYHLFTSLPCVIIMALPKALWEGARAPAYLVGALAMLIGIGVSFKCWQLPLALDLRKDLLMVLSILFVLLASPHLLTYDTTILLVPTWIVFFRWRSAYPGAKAARQMMLTLLTMFNLYVIVFLVPGDKPWPTLLCVLFAVFIVLLVRFLKALFAQAKVAQISSDC